MLFLSTAEKPDTVLHLPEVDLNAECGIATD